MSISAVIPVRAGSTRVKNKNIKPFAGSSLLEIKIRQLLAVSSIDEIIVSSDSEEMLALARKMGVTAKRRPIEYCDEKSRSFNDVVRFIANNQIATDTMIWAPCVCPMVSEKHFNEGIEIYNQIERGNRQGDSVATAVLFKEYLFDDKGPKNFSIEHHVTSQNLPNWHYIINGFFIAPTADMARWGFVYGTDPYLYEVNKLEAIDIDDELDFTMAEFMYDLLKSKGDQQ